MMKKLSFFLVILFSVTAFAYDLPRIAVYVTGEVHDNEKRALGTRMLASLINSGRYMGIERSNTFLAEIEREQEKQRSGAVDDDQISKLGRQFGVKYVCIADIIPAFGSYQVSARIVDVETAVVVFIGEAFSPLKSAYDLTQVSDEVARVMFGGQIKPKEIQITHTPESAKKITSDKPPRKPAFWAGIGLDALGAGTIIYGIIENRNVKKYDSDWEYSKAEKSASSRNTAYAIGTAFLLSGISIHIFF
jgi:hypothetical protein